MREKTNKQHNCPKKKKHSHMDQLLKSSRVCGLILISDYYQCGVSQVQPLSSWVPPGPSVSSHLPKTYHLVDWQL